MKNIRSLIKYTTRYKGYLWLAITAMLLQVIIGFLIPFIMIDIIDQAIPDGNMTMLINRSLIMIGLALLGAGTGLVNNYASNYVGQHAIMNLREDLFTHIQSLSFKNVDDLKKSRLITTATSDIQRVQMFFVMMLRIVVRAPLMVIVGLVLSLQTSLLLSQIFYVTMPLLIISFIVILLKAYPKFKKVQGALDDINNVVLENANAPQVVKSFVSQDYEQERFKKVNDHYKEVNTAAESILAAAEPIIIMIFNLGIALILVFAQIYLTQNNPSLFANGLPRIGLIMAFAQYSQQILIGLMMFAMILIFVSRAEVSAQRIQEVMLKNDYIYTPDHPVTQAVEGALRFDQVGFQYGASSAPAIDQISFSLKPGESLAVVGSTGSGKTSLTRLIPRLYEVSSGTIYLDDVPVQEYDIHHLRDQIGYVTQTAHIFSGSIGTNIALGKDATYESVEQATSEASLTPYIEKEDAGLNSLTAAKGTNLSGGQKQRVSIARALHKRPKVLILDDSTSAVDTATEKAIIQSIDGISPKPTLLLITQKIATAKRLDKILVLTNSGTMDGVGTHDELLKTSSVYQEIVASQGGQNVSA